MAELEKFTLALEKLRYGMYIVTSSFRNQPAGCTCVWVTRVAFTTPQVCVHLAPTRHTYQTIERGRRFCINVLGEDGLELARRFGFASGPSAHKFDGVAFRRGVSGSPVLEAALSYLDCKLVEIVPIGDHMMVLGELVDAAIQRDGRPLIYDPETFYTDEEQRAMYGEPDLQKAHQ